MMTWTRDDLLDLIRQELPALLETDTRLRYELVGMLAEVFPPRQELEEALARVPPRPEFEEALARVDHSLAAVEKALEEFRAEMARVHAGQEAMQQDIQRLDGKIDTTREELSGRIDVTREELGGRIDATREELHATREELGGRIDATREELHATREELGGRIDATREELGGRIDATREELHATREELGGCIDATREELGGRIDATREELHATREELGGRIDATQIQLEEAFHKEITRLGQRWGLMSEDILRQVVKAIVQETYGAQVTEVVIDGEQHDLVVTDGEHILLEVATRATQKIIRRLERKRARYTQETGIIPTRVILATAQIHYTVVKRLQEMGIEVIQPDILIEGEGDTGVEA